MKGFYSFKLEKKNRKKVLKLNIFYLVEKNSAFSCSVDRKLGSSIYCTFHKHAKAKRRLRFSLLSIILTDLLGNSTLLHGFKRSWFVICDWWISIRFVCFSVSRFVACDRNYDWRQRKTQLWKCLLNFRVRMFVKSTVKSQCSLWGSWIRRDQWTVGCLF